MNKVLDFTKVSMGKFMIKLMFITALLLVVINTFKYLLYGSDVTFFSFLTATNHMNIMTIVFFAGALIIETFTKRRVQCDQKEICFYKSFLFEKSVCIAYSDITMITERMGVVSIRSNKDIILLDALLFEQKDKQALIAFIVNQVPDVRINPAMEKGDKAAAIFGLAVLVAILGSFGLIFILR